MNEKLKEEFKEILNFNNLYSGSHEIDYEKANIFINDQLNYRRRKAAKNLIDNTIYITFDDIFKSIKNLIIKIYTDIENTNKKIYIYLGPKGKSNYMLGIIALYFIELLEYKIPIIIYDIDDNILDIIDDNIIIYIDDFSYSGNQLETILSSIFFKRKMFNNKILPDIYIGLCGASTYACDILSKLGIHNVIDVSIENKRKYRDFYKNPFKIYYDKIYESLYDKLNISDFLDILYYFSPGSYGMPIISLYLDHKMGDDVSTFNRTLIYGQILPAIIYENEDDFEEIYENMKYSIRHYENFNCDFFGNYWNNIIEEDSIIDLNINNIYFSPFIKNCNNIDIKFIPKNISYFYFIMSPSLLEKYIEYYPEDIELYKDIIKKLNSPNNRCPKSFYKSII